MPASTGKKSTGAKRSTAAPKPATKTPAKTAAATAKTKKPIRREVWALLCFFFALFTFIGCFKIDALFFT